MDHTPGRAHHIARLAVFAIDSIQRRRHHVFEFSDDPKCIIRISHIDSHDRVELSDGTVVRPGEPLLEIHFWNERVPPMPLTGPDLGWGLRFTNRWLHSLRLLARFVQSHPDFGDIVAIRGESSFAASTLEKYNQVTGHMGFDFRPLPQQESLGYVADLFTNLYVWAIVWALHPSTLRGRSVRSAERGELWMSRQALLARYGSRRGADSAPGQQAIRMPVPSRPAPGMAPAPSGADSQH